MVSLSPRSRQCPVLSAWACLEVLHSWAASLLPTGLWNTAPALPLLSHNRAVTMTFPLLHHSGSALRASIPKLHFLRTKPPVGGGGGVVVQVDRACGLRTPIALPPQGSPARPTGLPCLFCMSGSWAKAFTQVLGCVPLEAPGSPAAALGIWGSSRDCRSPALLARAGRALQGRPLCFVFLGRVDRFRIPGVGSCPVFQPAPVSFLTSLCSGGGAPLTRATPSAPTPPRQGRGLCPR